MSTSTIRHLSDAQLEIMQIIWSCTPPVNRATIEQSLKESHPMAMTTILTLLTRLVEKGALTMEKIGKANYYTPTYTREEYLASQSRTFFDQLCGGNMKAFAMALCDSGISKEDLDELRKMLDEGSL